MSAFGSAVTNIARRTHRASQASIVVSQADGREDPAPHRLLYVLGFGIIGAICANAAVFGYFAMFYVSG
jgi:hypothetical protein